MAASRARTVRLLRDSVAGGPALDTAVSRALLEAVARGEREESLRLWSPDDALAFSITDRLRAGFPAAVRLARARGFEPFLRLAGGRAAVYTRETLAFAWAIPSANAPDEIGARFEELAAVVVSGLRRLGVDARVGAVPGEYCPGAHSVNARGTRKLMGVGQRVVRGAAHVGGVIVLGASARLRGILEPVYAALELPFDPATAGSVEDEIGALPREEMLASLLASFAERVELADATIDADLLANARRFEARHRAEAPARPASAESKTAIEP